MTLANKILGVLSAIGAFFSAVFFVLFKQARIERKQEKCEQIQNEYKKQMEKLEGVKKYVEEKKENDSVVINNPDNFDDNIAFMHKLTEKGKQRNGNKTE